MASHNATNYARLTQVPPQVVDGGDYGGRVRVVYDDYTTTGEEGPGDTVRIGRLKAGQRVVGGQLVFGALGTDVTLKLGDAGDDDRYVAAGDASAAGSLPVAAGLGYRPAADADLVLTIGGAAPAAGQTIRLVLLTVGD